jgi:hypothetical protein
MLYNKINLFVAACLVIMIVFSIPVYNNWLNGKILNGANYGYQLSHQSTEERMSNRFGVPYNNYHSIANTLKSSHINDAIVLLPPSKYLKAVKVDGDFDVVEPEVFYYFTGYKSTSINSPMAARADWALVIENHKPGLRKITDTAFLNSLRILYKKYN